MRKGRRRTLHEIRVAIVLMFTTIAVCGFVIIDRSGSAVEPEILPAPTPRKLGTRSTSYSQFSHSTKAHAKDCSTCHKFPSENWNKVRIGDAAFEDITEYPKHESCLNCHRRQFFRGATPAICSVCHIAPSPRNAKRHPFPNPRELFDLSAKGRTAVSDFAISFSHEKHMEMITASMGTRTRFVDVSYEGSIRAEENCAVCHTTYQPQGDGAVEFYTRPPATVGDAFWLKKGTFKTVPLSHAQCFTCHSTDAGVEPTPSSCGACHKLRPAVGPSDFDAKAAASMKVTDKRTLEVWRARDSSATFRHEWLSHSELTCSTCHTVNAINTLDAGTKKVAIANCSTCHAAQSVADGAALNLEMEGRRTNPKFQCVKCHIAYGRMPTPPSHSKALAEATGK